MELRQLLDEVAWRKCCHVDPENLIESQLEGFRYFCEHYAKIKHPTLGRIPFILRVAQTDTARLWITERYTLILKSRQIGFSTLAATFALWETFFFSDRFEIMLSRTERESLKLLAKAKYVYKFLPPWMKVRGPELTNEHQLKMTFSNESAIESLPSGSDPARGESVYRVFVDEWAFLPNGEEAWASIEPIADVGGRVSGLSTANGSGNFFHQLWVGSQNGSNEFHSLFFPWSADGERNDEWYATKERNMSPHQIHQEYPRNAQEAFIKSGNPVFNIKLLEEMSTLVPETGYYQLLPTGGAEFRPAAEGEMEVWAHPEKAGVYVIFADVAEGLTYGDYSSAHVLDARTGELVATYHAHIEPDTFGVVLAEIGWWYNTALLGVENNNHGLTTLKAAQKHDYHNLFRQRRMGKLHSPPTDVLGWRTTTSTKALMIDELAGALRDGSVTIYCTKTIAELKTFVRKDGGKMAGSPFDDRVISIAGAVQMLKFAWTPEYRIDVKPPRNSLAWWEKFLLKSELKAQPMGSDHVRSTHSRP